MIRTIIAAAAVVFASVAVTAQAMPLAPLEPANATVIQIAGGCGAGWHRGPYGGCLRNYADPDAHACPRGFHIGPNGGCRGNGR
jgi:hypothetical protein